MKKIIGSIFAVVLMGLALTSCSPISEDGTENPFTSVIVKLQDGSEVTCVVHKWSNQDAVAPSCNWLGYENAKKDSAFE